MDVALAPRPCVLPAAELTSAASEVQPESFSRNPDRAPPHARRR
jgi:hypothetical protein